MAKGLKCVWSSCYCAMCIYLHWNINAIIIWHMDRIYACLQYLAALLICSCIYNCISITLAANVSVSELYCVVALKYFVAAIASWGFALCILGDSSHNTTQLICNAQLWLRVRLNNLSVSQSVSPLPWGLFNFNQCLQSGLFDGQKLIRS